MGALIGLCGGLGLTMIASWFVDPVSTSTRRRRRGCVKRSGSLVLASVGAFVATAIVVAIMTGTAVVGLAVGVMAAALPRAVARGRQARAARSRRAAWPDAVDHLASAVRAGLSLPEAVVALGERGPDVLRADFAQFERDYRTTGRFDDALDLLKRRLADPVGDRVVESLRIARQVGGGDLGRVLRALSSFLRDDLRTRGELESRQSWTVNGARLAVSAPWLVLLTMSAQPEVIERYATPAGALILIGGALTCVVAYRLMAWIGRLPTERRVLA